MLTLENDGVSALKRLLTHLKARERIDSETSPWPFDLSATK
jgi:hypothetical protein